VDEGKQAALDDIKQKFDLSARMLTNPPLFLSFRFLFLSFSFFNTQ
jgi:hypothetical protein